MPFFFGQRSSTAAVAAAAGAHHHRQSSLSLSSSKKDRLAEVRAQTLAMAQSGELTLSRSKTSSGHTRMSSSGHTRMTSSGHKPTLNQTGPYTPRHIVVVEPDNDDSKHQRIDQGILDASREALAEQNQVRQRLQDQQKQVQPTKSQSWWSSAWSSAAPVVSSEALNTPVREVGAGGLDGDEAILQRKTTFSKTFRVP